MAAHPAVPLSSSLPTLCKVTRPLGVTAELCFLNHTTFESQSLDGLYDWVTAAKAVSLYLTDACLHKTVQLLFV